MSCTNGRTYSIEINGDLIANNCAYAPDEYENSESKRRSLVPVYVRTTASMGGCSLLVKLWQVILYHYEHERLQFELSNFKLKHAGGDGRKEERYSGVCMSETDSARPDLRIYAPIQSHVPMNPLFDKHLQDTGSVASTGNTFLAAYLELLRAVGRDPSEYSYWRSFWEVGVADNSGVKPPDIEGIVFKSGGGASPVEWSFDRMDDRPDRERFRTHSLSGMEFSLEFEVQAKRFCPVADKKAATISGDDLLEQLPFLALGRDPVEELKGKCTSAPRGIKDLYDCESATVKELKGENESRIVFLSDSSLRDDHHVAVGEIHSSPDDPNWAFREKLKSWPKFLQKGANGKHLEAHELPNLIVYQCEDPITEGTLFATLHGNKSLRERTILVVSGDSLRHSVVLVGQGLSWEKIAQDTVWAVRNNSRIRKVSDFAHVVVAFKCGGAVVVSRNVSGERSADGSEPASTLLYTPDELEDEFEMKYPGTIFAKLVPISFLIGLNALFGPIATTGGSPSAPEKHSVNEVPREVPSHKELCLAIHAGLMTLRDMHLTGLEDYRTEQSGTRYFEWPYRYVALRGFMNLVTMRLGEAKQISASLGNDGVWAKIHNQASSTIKLQDESWTILQSMLEKESDDPFHQELEALKLARSIALQGAERATAHHKVPIGRFSEMVVVDRFEIESIRSIGRLVKEYARDGTIRPLGVCVFGAPGSGKSFGVKCILDSLKDRKGRLEGKQIIFISNNLAQMTESGLGACFHAINTEVIKGKLPVVLWDEFDTGVGMPWLRHFLAPLQDGEFQSEGRVFPIGKSIHFFAGSVCTTHLELSAKAGMTGFEFSKIKDFVSRQKGYLNITGLNMQECGGRRASSMIRRAILLRALCKQNYQNSIFDRDILQIDDSLLTAFLTVDSFEHGSRSMEAIIRMSALAGRKRFSRSRLPSKRQLGLHTNGDEFLRILLQEEVDYGLWMLAGDQSFSAGKVSTNSSEYLTTHPLYKHRSHFIANAIRHGGFTLRLLRRALREKPVSDVFPNAECYADIVSSKYAPHLADRDANERSGPAERLRTVVQATLKKFVSDLQEPLRLSKLCKRTKHATFDQAAFTQWGNQFEARFNETAGDCAQAISELRGLIQESESLFEVDPSDFVKNVLPKLRERVTAHIQSGKGPNSNPTPATATRGATLESVWSIIEDSESPTLDHALLDLLQHVFGVAFEWVPIPGSREGSTGTK